VPPKVIAWALLFVVVFAVIYRVVRSTRTWIGARRGRRAAADTVAVTAPPREEVAAPTANVATRDVAQAPVPVTVPHAIAEDSAHETPLADPQTVPLPAPAHAYARAHDADDPAVAPTPEAASKRTVPVIVRPLACAPVMAARMAEALVLASGGRPRVALAPSVAATLPPASQISRAATPSLPEPAVVESDVIEIAGDDVTRESVDADDTAMAIPAPAAQDDERLSPAGLLRSWRLGSEEIDLDLRLLWSRYRRPQRPSKILRVSRKSGVAPPHPDPLAGERVGIGRRGKPRLRVLEIDRKRPRAGALRILARGAFEGAVAKARVVPKILGR
jgi:hypothetical protein